MFCCENVLVYPVHISGEKFKNCTDLLLITNESKSNYVYIEDFNRFTCNKAKCKNKNNTFASIVYHVLVVKTFR